MIILGISCFYHDSSACILKNGKIVAAAAEERFTRKKHDNNFPNHAINFCLAYLGIAANEVAIVAFYEKPFIKFERILSQHLEHFPRSHKVFINSLGTWLNQKLQIKKILREEFNYHGKIVFIPHHLAHAASSYYLSGFNNSAIVTLDGVGEWATTTMGFGQGSKIKIDKEVRFPHSLGLLYSTLTAYLGFKVNSDEYKVMGLAAYGTPKPFKSHFDKLITTYADGSFAFNMNYFDYTWSDHMPGKEMEKLFGYPIRPTESKIKKYHKDIAASLQAKLEEVVYKLLNVAYKKYKTSNLCLAGGVALNSVMNGKIIKNTPFKKIYVPPDPGDGGGAMGAAIYTHYSYSSKKLNKKFSPYLGPQYLWYEVEPILKKNKLKYTLFTNSQRMLNKIAEMIVHEKVIGWFHGRMEWGPRALGARSILASAAKAEMKDIINAKVKKREMFRPFAPVVLEEYASDYFKIDKQPPVLGKYMLIVIPFKDKGKKDVPATVHVDGSGRLQTIARRDNPLYYDLIKTYMKKTGIPIIINTSFNVRGEPIVCSPEEAVNCFLSTGIDVLVIDNFVVTKKIDD